MHTISDGSEYRRGAIALKSLFEEKLLRARKPKVDVRVALSSVGRLITFFMSFQRGRGEEKEIKKEKEEKDGFNDLVQLPMVDKPSATCQKLERDEFRGLRKRTRIKKSRVTQIGASIVFEASTGRKALKVGQTEIAQP
ncbi:hypothetical protein HZH68_000466 [Vespula germanica]|uniref:Uncharacterized protein n=1 Tax=Vespula germanica TaxID=30212 RepID=A0A834U614_VESGE|nr:hypothetical protein HZH68_000466 [Vespula germanica]